MTDSDKYMQNGYACMSQNNFAQAIEYFQAVLQSDPKNEEAKMCLYLAYTKQGKPQYAKQYRTKVELSDSIPPLDASYVKWHKEQVIEKWKSVFKAESFLTPNGDLVDDSAIISYQLILSPLKTSSPSQEKSNYFYLLHPLYSNKKRDVMPKLCGEMEVVKEKKKNRLIVGTHYDFSVHSVMQSSLFAWKTSNDFTPRHLEDVRSDSQLEKVEYDYYQLWANHYLGLWQWEKWNPLANIKDTVGKKYIIIGVDNEMREIASQLNEESEKYGKEIFSLHNDSVVEELTPQFQKQIGLKSFRVNMDDIDLCQINPLKNKHGNYGEYFVSNVIVRDAAGDMASAVFGSYEGQELTLGGSFHVVMSHSDAKDGACIIV